MRVRLRSVYGLLGLPLLLLVFGNPFLYLAGTEFSDLTVSHLPNALFLRHALLTWGQIPLWANNILSGYPFVANPLSGLFYPPGWLAVLWPDAWTFNLLVALHLMWGGMGVARLLKQQGLRDVPAVFGGLAFALMPKLFAHYAAGHVTLVYAVAWTPWLLLATRHSPVPTFSVWPSLLLAFIFFADVRWAAFAGVLWVGWSLLGGNACNQINSGEGLGKETSRATSPASAPRPETSPLPTEKSASLRVYPRPVFLLLQLLLAAAFAAPLALPLLEFVRLSTRAALGAEDVLAFSLPPARLLGLLFPEMGGNPEWIIYPGVLTLALALIGLFWRDVRQKTRFWWGVWVVSMLYSLGENIPGLGILAGLPGFSLLRVPPRAMFLAGMALAILAAYTFDHLLAGVQADDRRRGMQALVGLLGVTAMMAVGVQVLTGAVSMNFVWGAGMAGGTLLVVGWMLGARRTGMGWVSLALIGISVLDWGGVAARSVSPRPAVEVYAEKADLATYLAAQWGFFRVYSPSYSLPQHTAVRFGLEMADGVDPMQLQSYTAFMAEATGVPQGGYSVTLPPFLGDIRVANAGYPPDAMQLAQLNVRYVVAEFDLNVAGLEQVEMFGHTRVYENTRARGRAWVEGGEPVPAENILWSPNRIELTATGPGWLVLSEIAYPGWRVEVDAQPAELLTVYELLRGVNLPAGNHEVVFSFRPPTFYGGLGLLIIALFVVLLIKRKK